MRTLVHKAESRGHANFGWLDSRHTFSFGRYYNPERMNFGVLRVLNDDVVQGGAGFGTHPHDNMEIVSIPLKGALEHRDNMGNSSVIHTGDVQIMSAGAGVTHSEYNHSATEEVNFLQIWILPEQRNIAARYEQKAFKAADRANRFQAVVSPEKGSSALWINQQARFHLGDFSAGAAAEYTLHRPGNGVYLFVIEGAVECAGEQLGRRDALGAWETERLAVRAVEDAQLLLMEVPMS